MEGTTHVSSATHGRPTPELSGTEYDHLEIVISNLIMGPPIHNINTATYISVIAYEMPTLNRDEHTLLGRYPLSHAAFPYFIHFPGARPEEVMLLPFIKHTIIHFECHSARSANHY